MLCSLLIPLFVAARAASPPIGWIPVELRAECEGAPVTVDRLELRCADGRWPWLEYKQWRWTAARFLDLAPEPDRVVSVVPAGMRLGAFAFDGTRGLTERLVVADPWRVAPNGLFEVRLETPTIRAPRRLAVKRTVPRPWDSFTWATASWTPPRSASSPPC